MKLFYSSEVPPPDAEGMTSPSEGTMLHKRSSFPLPGDEKGLFFFLHCLVGPNDSIRREPSLLIERYVNVLLPARGASSLPSLQRGYLSR